MRIVALLATYNEERFVGQCIDHLAEQGVETYLIDNGSTDSTVTAAKERQDGGLAGLESVPRHGVYSWRPLLERKAELAAAIEADWFIHVEADEIRLPPPGFDTLAAALAAADAAGYNAVNFQEFTFVPTREEPDHDHPRFQETMRHYYPFLPRPGLPDRLNAWKRQHEAVDLATNGGHLVEFPNLRMFPQSFRMKHYLYLSVDHATRKYVQRSYDPAEVADGWHLVRAALQAADITLMSRAELRGSRTDDDLDPSDPFTAHPLFSRHR